MSYTLSLTNQEFDTIKFVASRGYSEAVYAALMSELTTTDECGDSATYYIPEHLAWEIKDEQENNGGHHFGPISDELTIKLYEFVDRIV